MTIKEKLTRAEQKYILWKSSKIRNEYGEDDFTASMLINYLVLSVILKADNPEQLEIENTPFGKIERVKQDFIDQYLDTHGIDDIGKELKFFENLINEAPCLFFLRNIGRTGSGSGYGENSRATDVENATP